MKPKHQRLVFVVVSIIFLCVATLLTLRAFSENLVFFYSPSDLADQAKRPDTSRMIRVGGLIEVGSISRPEADMVRFIVSDGNASLAIEYRGLLPNLFREGQGAIAEGHLRAPGEFKAERILTKHDENYMPKEVVDSLKKTGHWKEEGGKYGR